MDSKMAVVIADTLNRELALNLPPNICHNHIDLSDLTKAVLFKLNVSEAPQRDAFQPKKDPRVPKAIEVVIVGEALRLPGGLNTPSAFWTALVDRRSDLMTETPLDRWDHASFYTSSSEPKPGDITFKRSGFVEISSFDNAFFGISGPEALGVSPSARLVLETAFDALEDANIPTSKIKGSDMAVYIASGDDGYNQLLFQESGYSCYNRHFGTGIANSAICGRLS
jgi:acyl transferase domain-containing protein